MTGSWREAWTLTDSKQMIDPPPILRDNAHADKFTICCREIGVEAIKARNQEHFRRRTHGRDAGLEIQLN